MGAIITDNLIMCLDAASPYSYPGSGSTWTDLSGHGNHATLASAPTFSTSNGGCFNFNGTSQYMTIGTSSSTHLLNPAVATASVWFRVEGETGSYGGIFAAQYRWGFIYINDGAGSYLDETVLSYTWGGGSIMEPTTTLSAGWHQAVTAWTASGGSNSASLYIDGVLAVQGQIIYSGGTSILEIGRSDSSSQYFNGDVAVVHMYNSVLTHSEIKENYVAQRGRFTI